MAEVSQTTNFTDIQQAYVVSQPTIQEWTNNTSFYVLYPKYYFSFANRWLRRWLGWYDGYVLGVHDGTGGLLSTRIGTTLVKRLTQQIYGGGLLFEAQDKGENGKKALEKINSYNRATNFSSKIQMAMEFAGAGGTCAIKANVSKAKKIDLKNDIWYDAFRADRFYADIDFKGEVVRARFLVNKFTNTVPNMKTEEHFYICEDRYYKKECLGELEYGELKPYAEYKVIRVSGDVAMLDVPLQSQRSLGFSELPKEVQNSIKEEYGVLELNKPQLLPFEDLGVDIMRFTNFISNLPDLQFGESLLAPIQTYLFMYDYMYSCFNTDLYLGRGRVMVPKWMQKPRGEKPNQAPNWNAGLDSFLYTQYDTIDGEQQKPLPVQFELRSTDWVTTRNNLLEAMATALGISPSTIASYLSDNTVRTAREISSEESSTTLYIESKRDLMKNVINRCIKRVLRYYGIAEDVTVKFSKAGQTNISVQTENVIKKVGAGVMSLREAIQALNSDWTTEQVDTELIRIQEDKKNQQATQQSELFGNLNYNESDGDFVNETSNSNSEKAKTELAGTDTGRDANQNKTSN